MLKSKEEISAACGDLIAARPFCDPVRLAIAKTYQQRRFEDYCDNHGVTEFRVKDGKCVKCSDTPDTPRIIARRAGEPSFMGECEIHGEAAHGVAHGKCLACFTMNGAHRSTLKRRPPKSPERRAAEAAKVRSYVATCYMHGDVHFWTHSGRCMTCYTVASKPRCSQGPSSARAVARQHGLTQYRGHCGVHGWTAHSVGPGRCLTCFNAMGYRRPAR